ncbi:unnamed protein product [Closterium sp. NIES-64]|nr:unnamed protein product [Closterium sp. NIES-64]
MRKAASGSDSFVVTRRQAFACVAVLFATMLSLSAISHRLGHTSGFRAAQLSLSINSHLANTASAVGGVSSSQRGEIAPNVITTGEGNPCGEIASRHGACVAPCQRRTKAGHCPILETSRKSPVAGTGGPAVVRPRARCPSSPPIPFFFFPIPLRFPPITDSPNQPTVASAARGGPAARVDLLVRSHVSDAFLSPHPPFPSFPPIPPVFPPSSVFPPSLTPTSPLWPARVDLLVRSHVSDALHSPPIPLSSPSSTPAPISAFPDSPQTSPLWPARVDLLPPVASTCRPAGAQPRVRRPSFSFHPPPFSSHLPFFSPPIAPVSPLTSPLWPARVDLLVRSHVSDAYFLIEVLFRSIEQMWPRGIGDVILVLDEGEIVVRDLVPPWVKVYYETNYLDLPGKILQQWSYLWADNYTTAPYIAIIDDDVVFNLKVTPGLLFNLTEGKPIVIGSRNAQRNNWLPSTPSPSLLSPSPLPPLPCLPSPQVTPGLLFNLTEGKPIVIGSRNAQRNNWLPSTRWLVGQHAYFANFMVQLPFVFPRDVLPRFREHVGELHRDKFGKSFDKAFKTQIAHTTLGNYMWAFTQDEVSRQGWDHVSRQGWDHVSRQGWDHVSRQGWDHVSRQGWDHVSRQGRDHNGPTTYPFPEWASTYQLFPEWASTYQLFPEWASTYQLFLEWASTYQLFPEWASTYQLFPEWASTYQLFPEWASTYQLFPEWASTYQLFLEWASTYQLFPEWASTYQLFPEWASTYQLFPEWASTYQLFPEWASTYQLFPEWASTYQLFPEWASTYPILFLIRRLPSLTHPNPHLCSPPSGALGARVDRPHTHSPRESAHTLLCFSCFLITLSASPHHLSPIRCTGL